MHEGFLRMPEVTNNYLTGHPVEDKSVSVRLAVLVSLRSCGGANHRCIITGGIADNPSLIKLSHCVTCDRNSPCQKQPKDPNMAAFVSPFHGLCPFPKGCKILSAFELKKKRA